MNLQEYAQLILPDANSAKNHISYLIGYLDKSDQAGAGILGLFESLPQSYRDKNLFSPVMQKFFTHYRINGKNEKYYQEYSSSWKPHEIEEVKLKNTHWQWDKTNYKNSLEFVKALSSRENIGKKYKFIKNNKDTFLKLIHKDKNKLVSNMNKYQIFMGLTTESDYCHLIKFCDEYGFDKKEILQNCILNRSYNFYHIFEKSHTPEFFSMIEDFKNNGFLEGTNFFKYRAKEKVDTANITILDFYYITLCHDKIAESFKLLDMFLPEIEISLSFYLRDKKYDNMNIYEKLEKVGNIICKELKSNNYYSQQECRYIISNQLEPKLKNFNTYIFKEKLEIEVNQKETKISKVKI